jgi:hypothetical protein
VGSHERIGIFRVFGRDAGYTALYTAYVTSEGAEWEGYTVKEYGPADAFGKRFVLLQSNPRTRIRPGKNRCSYRIYFRLHSAQEAAGTRIG